MQPDPREMVYFAAIETDKLEPQPIPDPGVNVTAVQRSSSEKIVDGFLQNHTRLLAEPEVTIRIEQIENIFLALGRFHELMAVYRDDWEQKGPASYVADRYAWGLVRLGQGKRARAVIDALLVARPNEGRIHFLDGAEYLQEQPPNPANFAKIVAAWRKVLEVEPTYVGYEGIDAEMLKVEIEKFAERIPPDAVPAPTAEVTPPPEGEGADPQAPPAAEVAVAPEPSAEPAPEIAPESGPSVPPPAPVAPEMTAEQRYQIAVAEGQIALGQGNYRAAEGAFLRAKAIKPGAFEAEFGHLQAGWGTEAARNDVSAQMRTLSERHDLTPAQRVEVGVFLWAKMGRNDLAKQQWESAKAADPSLASRVDPLLAKLK